jgi:hypothetical protein
MIPSQPQQSDARVQQSVLHLPTEENHHWDGLPTFEQDASFDAISATVPQFEQLPFQLGSGQPPNPFYRVISRKAAGNSPAIPVGLVSANYRLIQHQEVLAAIRTALVSPKFEVGKLACNATFTTHHERMALRVNMPSSHQVDAGDGYPIGLQLCVFNSVDGRSSFGIHLGWFRFVCSNGLIVGTTAAKWKKPHRDSLNLDTIGEVLKDGFQKAEREQLMFKRAAERKVSLPNLEQWADGPLVKAWGVKAATRALHILATGRDCRLANPFKKALPSQHAIIPTEEVPGAVSPPATQFSVMQALSWISSHCNALKDRVTMTRQIAELLVRLPHS